jgi:lanosterol synthase
MAHRKRLGDYLHLAPDGLKMNGYNSSELWNTAFAVQAIASTGQIEKMGSTLRQAAQFIEANQVLDNTKDYKRYFRHPSRGGWPFSTRQHGWPISDCTAEGIKSSLLLQSAGLSRVPFERIGQAIDLILSLQNRDGGWATYERTRGPQWLELLNPSDVFARIMVDYSYVECTSACIQALAHYLRAAGTLEVRKRRAILRAIDGGRRYLVKAQRADGSWEGSWGVCFTYGTWFGVLGLRAAGVSTDHPSIRNAVRFLGKRQRADGGWSETLQSCRTRSYVEGVRSHAVMTSWALLTLAAAGEVATERVRRGVEWLRSQQGTDGRWPPEPIAGVFNRTCGIHYHAYLFVFPVWAIAVCSEGARHSLPVGTRGTFAA